MSLSVKRYDFLLTPTLGSDSTHIPEAFLKAQGQDLRIYLMMQKIQVDAMAKHVQMMQSQVDTIVTASMGSSLPGGDIIAGWEVGWWGGREGDEGRKRGM